MSHGHDSATKNNVTHAYDPAFGHGAENGHCCGVTVREYFAAAALQGIAASMSHPANQSSYAGNNTEDTDRLAARAAVRMADFLIDALNVETNAETSAT